MSASPVSHHRRRGLRAPWVSAASLTAMMLGAVFLGAGPASARATGMLGRRSRRRRRWRPRCRHRDAVVRPAGQAERRSDRGVLQRGEPRASANPKAPTARRLYTADNFSGLSSQAGARFGASVAVWGAAFDDLDDCADLLVGAPGQNVGGKAGAGQVFQLRGSAGGLNGVVKTFDEARCERRNAGRRRLRHGARSVQLEHHRDRRAGARHRRSH